MRYRVHRIKDSVQESFRWSPHTGGCAAIKPKDYRLDGEAEAATPYAAWKLLANQGFPLRAGDVLESLDDSGEPHKLYIAKYIGLEPAEWFVATQATDVHRAPSAPEFSDAPQPGSPLQP
jgi:hypothetical protein